MNECLNQPCKNGGLCRDLDGDYTCHCTSPYVGKQCQLREFLFTANDFPVAVFNFSFEYHNIHFRVPYG